MYVAADNSVITFTSTVFTHFKRKMVYIFILKSVKEVRQWKMRLFGVRYIDQLVQALIHRLNRSEQGGGQIAQATAAVLWFDSLQCLTLLVL